MPVDSEMMTFKKLLVLGCRAVLLSSLSFSAGIWAKSVDNDALQHTHKTGGGDTLQHAHAPSDGPGAQLAIKTNFSEIERTVKERHSGAQTDPVRLDAKNPDVDLWPHTTMLADESGEMTISDVKSMGRRFTSVKGERYSNLGLRNGSVWLRIAIEPILDAKEPWILSFGYALLARAEIFLLADGDVVQTADVGYSSVPQTGAPPNSRLATTLKLAPGVPYELLVRVTSEGSLLVPMHLTQQRTFQSADVKNQMLQGIFAGIGLCLIAYALTYAIILRRGLYAAYAASVTCMAVFLFSLQGMGAEHLWGSWAWASKHIAHFSIFLNIAANTWFVHDTMEVRTQAPRLSIAIRIVRGLCLAFAVLIVLDLMNFRGAHLAATTMGQAAALVIVCIMWLRAQRSQSSLTDWLIFGGWAAYAVGSLALTWTFTGFVNYNPNIWNFFQATAMLEMLSWFIVLGVDAREKYQASIRLRGERNSMQSLAETDVLTGLPNRRSLMSRMEKALPNTPPGTTCAVFMMDLDGFKAVNDVHGHHAGDELLKAVGARLTQTLRGRDFVGRLGGDEFVVLTESLAHPDDAQRLANKLITRFKEPFNLPEGCLSVGLTIGFALAPMDGIKADDLLQAADQALYSGKQAGKGQARRATPEQVRLCALPSPLS